MKKFYLYPLILPHYLCYLFCVQKRQIKMDIEEMNRRLKKNKGLFFYLAEYAPYRNLFYHRIGILSMFLRILLPQYSYFFIRKRTKIGGGAFVLNHPYGTIINAHSIGEYFTICQLTTIGNKQHGRNDLVPIIGNHVSLGANVNIIGNITIGDNVAVGAGSVVVKNVPNNCIVAGNPAKIVKTDIDQTTTPLFPIKK